MVLRANGPRARAHERHRQRLIDAGFDASRLAVGTWADALDGTDGQSPAESRREAAVDFRRVVPGSTSGLIVMDVALKTAFARGEAKMPIGDWVSGRVFRLVHRHNLVYNACWEDPRLDRAALRLGPDDSVLAITSAGCNALDYALAGAGRVVAVNLNPRQNALLELKLAGIRSLDYEDFFSMFGLGRLDRAGAVYAERLRDALSPWRARVLGPLDRILRAGQPSPFLLPRHVRGVRHGDELLRRSHRAASPLARRDARGVHARRAAANL